MKTLCRISSVVAIIFVLSGCATRKPPERIEGAVELGQDLLDDRPSTGWYVSEGSYEVVGGTVRAVDSPDESIMPGAHLRAIQAVDAYKMSRFLMGFVEMFN